MDGSAYCIYRRVPKIGMIGATSSAGERYFNIGMMAGFILALVACLGTVIFLLRKKLALSRERIHIGEETINRQLVSLKDFEDSMNSLSEQNDWLVTEMHHRVKNYLQIVNSLINSQMAYVKDATSKETLRDSRHRLYALSLVHQKLFQTSMISNLEVPCYIVELVEYLVDEFGAREHVQFEFDMVPLTLNISLAIPLGLIVNELVSNTLKYAFPADLPGKVHVSLIHLDNEHYRFVFTDNGVGLPAGFDMDTSGSLGASLITGLAGQMKGKIDIQSDAGVIVTIDFKTRHKKEYQLAS